MGRKTNSVSLRLKKTNRDYNNCWYSDILYAESFSKSLKIENYLSQTLKTIGMPCPQTSVMGAFKKATLLVCYLDPKKRKRLLEKSSKGMQSKARTLQASVVNRSGIKAFVSLGKVKQDSKALLKPLQTILQRNFGPLPLQYESEWPYTTVNNSTAYSANAPFKVDYASQKDHRIVTQNTELEPSLVSLARPRKQLATEKTTFPVKTKVRQKAEVLSKTITTRPFYFYRGSISLDLVQNREFAIDRPFHTCSWPCQTKPLMAFYSICNFLCSQTGIETIKKKPCKKKKSKINKARGIGLFDATVLTKNHRLNKNNIPPEPFVFSSKAHSKIGNSFSLKGCFFVKKQESIQSSDCNWLFPALGYFKDINCQGNIVPLSNKLHTLFFSKKKYKKKAFDFKKKQELILQKDECKVNHAIKEYTLQKHVSPITFTGLQYFPFFFENKKSNAKVWSRFYNFSFFFYNEISNVALISTFFKNSESFGKNRQSYRGFSRTPFSCLSKSLVNMPVSNENFTKKKHMETVKVGMVRMMPVVLRGAVVVVPKGGQGGNERDNQKGNQKSTGKPFCLPLLSTTTNQINNKKRYNPALFEKTKNCSYTSLYGFYNSISSFWGNLACLAFYKSTNETSCALFLAECVGYLLEKKVSFRSLKRQLLLDLHQSKYGFNAKKASVMWAPQITNPTSQALAPFLENKRKVTGIRITCSGRVGGRSKKAQRSRKDTFMWGETGLHVFSTKLDFAKTHAETSFGLVGVQVWVCSK